MPTATWINNNRDSLTLVYVFHITCEESTHTESVCHEWKNKGGEQFVSVCAKRGTSAIFILLQLRRHIAATWNVWRCIKTKLNVHSHGNEDEFIAFATRGNAFCPVCVFYGTEWLSQWVTPWSRSGSPRWWPTCSNWPIWRPLQSC